MRTFHRCVFDDAIEGTSAVYTGAQWNAVLGLADKLKLVAITDQASGTTPTLTVQIEESADQRNWASKSGTAEINALSVGTSATEIKTGNDAGTVPTGGFVRLRLQLGGTTPKVHVKLYVTGRGELIAS